MTPRRSSWRSWNRLSGNIASALRDSAAFAPLLSLQVPEERYPPLSLSPQRQRQKLLEALLAIFLELAAQQPVVFIVENLHWVDPSTLDFLSLLVEQAPLYASIQSVDVSSRFCAPLDGTGSPHLPRAHPLSAPAGGAIDHYCGRGKAVTHCCGPTDYGPYRWRTAICRRTDQNSVGVRSAARR